MPITPSERTQAASRRFLCVGGPLAGRVGDMPSEYRYCYFPLVKRPPRVSDLGAMVRNIEVDVTRYRWHFTAVTFPFGRFEATALVWDDIDGPEADRAALAGCITMMIANVFGSTGGGAKEETHDRDQATARGE